MLKQTIDSSGGGRSRRSASVRGFLIPLGEFLASGKAKFREIYANSINGRQIIVYFFSKLVDEEHADNSTVTPEDIRVINMAKKKLGLVDLEYVEFHDSVIVMK